MKQQETMPVYEAPASKVIFVRLQRVMCQSIPPASNEDFDELNFTL